MVTGTPTTARGGSPSLSEEHIAALGLPATIPRPAAFMENFGSLMFRTTRLSMTKTYLREDLPLQLVSARDVGWFAARAFSEPEHWIGQAVELAGDAVTRPQAVAVVRRAGRTPV